MIAYKLPYIREDVTEIETAYGFTEIIGIEQYKDSVLRDKVVFRIDLLYALSKYFTEETLNKYRTLIYNIVVGNNRNKKLISKILKALYLEDIRFKAYIGEVIYFDESLNVNSLYSVVISSMQDILRNKKIDLIEALKKKNVTFVADSHCYIYAAVNDKEIIVSVPAGYREEVVSRAKIWKGDFSKY